MTLACAVCRSYMVAGTVETDGHVAALCAEHLNPVLVTAEVIDQREAKEGLRAAEALERMTGGSETDPQPEPESQPEQPQLPPDTGPEPPVIACAGCGSGSVIHSVEGEAGVYPLCGICFEKLPDRAAAAKASQDAALRHELRQKGLI